VPLPPQSPPLTLPLAPPVVPDVDRGLAFANAFVICTVQILAKGVATALLATTNSSWLRSYVIGDLGLYLLYRVVRRDFFVFVQGGLGISVVVSFVVRAFEKLLVDYTGTPHVRLPVRNEASTRAKRARERSEASTRAKRARERAKRARRHSEHSSEASVSGESPSPHPSLLAPSTPSLLDLALLSC
jgi:hypothetical protein